MKLNDIVLSPDVEGVVEKGDEAEAGWLLSDLKVGKFAPGRKDGIHPLISGRFVAGAQDFDKGGSARVEGLKVNPTRTTKTTDDLLVLGKANIFVGKEVGYIVGNGAGEV